MKTIFLLLLSIGSLAAAATAQTADEAVMKTIAEKDELFWSGYNACDDVRMGEFIADDIEFYHDKGGITLGKAALVDSIKKNLCGNPNFRTRREASPGTVKIYLLKNSKATYGALVSGDHYFFNSQDGRPERRDGLAKFVNMWILRDDVWKMSRVLSYDHRPAPFENKRQAKNLPDKTLRRWRGRYVGARSGRSDVTVENGVLTVVTGNGRFVLVPESDNLFFVRDRDLTFEFVSEKGKVAGMIIRENGEIVDEARREP